MSGSTISIVGRRSAGIDRSPALLDGKRIGVATATSSHHFLDSVLMANAVDPRRATPVPLARERLASALVEGRIDVYSGDTNPVASALFALGVDGVTLDRPLRQAVAAAVRP